jgi:hypothetical protein
MPRLALPGCTDRYRESWNSILLQDSLAVRMIQHPDVVLVDGGGLINEGGDNVVGPGYYTGSFRTENMSSKCLIRLRLLGSNIVWWYYEGPY